MANNKRRRRLGAIVVLIGAILLIVAAFIPWYTWQLKASFEGASVTGTISTYPGLPSQNGTIQTSYSCSNVPAGHCPSGTSSSYSKDYLNNTGQLAEAGFYMLIVGFVLGLIGGVIGLASGSNSRRAGPAIALAIIAMILAVAAVGMFAGLLPNAIGKDSPGHTGDGPWSSFTGSTSNTTYLEFPATSTWGPGIGWYLTIGAFVVLVVGLVVLFAARKDPPEPAPVSVPAPTPTGMTTGTSSSATSTSP